ncbi:unnamed protein product [Cylicocyclus nassatus]|uniref:Uncharacterized protein n=1 Tax=Cylicocyclus nassatus TaxID=53992 RepID=A0AA36H785_CYLNA|nr:unnamed protein product [Cylicocyclus nassatus]
MDEFDLDTMNYALFSLETLTNVLFIFVVGVLFYVCIYQKSLHANFRATLFLAACGHLGGSVHRIILVSIRIVSIGKRDTPIVGQLYLLQITALYIAMFGWLFVIVERAIATVYSSKYEKHFAGFGVPAILCGIVLTMSALFLCISIFHLFAYFDFFFLGLQIVVVLVCFVAVSIMLVYNSSAYRSRHDSMLQLADRYQLDENVRVAKYLMPVAVNEVLVKFVYISLLAYSVFFTDIPLGHDTTHLSHAYDLLFAYQRMFFGLALTLRSDKFGRYKQREKRRVAAMMDDRVAASSSYFTDLKTMWA